MNTSLKHWFFILFTCLCMSGCRTQQTACPAFGSSVGSQIHTPFDQWRQLSIVPEDLFQKKPVYGLNKASRTIESPWQFRMEPIRKLPEVATELALSEFRADRRLTALPAKFKAKRVDKSQLRLVGASAAVVPTTKLAGQKTQQSAFATPSKTYLEQAKLKDKRKEAVVKGGAILLMAVVAGMSIPLLGSAAASVGLVVILLLDILISLGILRYYRESRPKLARFTGWSRLVYSGIFGVGIAYHIFGNVAMFNQFWSIGLITFGIHLLSLGLLFTNENGKKWVNYTIKSLLIVAGIGYMTLNIGVLLAPNPVAFRALIEPIFIAPQILGEVWFALWMLVKGGKK